jgi:hypothetical protein
MIDTASPPKKRGVLAILYLDSMFPALSQP